MTTIPVKTTNVIAIVRNHPFRASYDYKYTVYLSAYGEEYANGSGDTQQEALDEAVLNLIDALRKAQKGKMP